MANQQLLPGETETPIQAAPSGNAGLMPGETETPVSGQAARATTVAPSPAGKGGWATQRNSQAQPGVTPEMRQTSPVNQGLQEGATDWWSEIKNAPENFVKGIWHSLPPVELADNVKQILPIIDTYEKSRSSGASVTDSLTAANNHAAEQAKASSTVLQRVAAFKQNPTRESVRGLVDAVGLAAGTYGIGGVAGEVADTLAESPTSKFDHILNADSGKIEPLGTAKQEQVINATEKSGISRGVPETIAPSDETIQPNLHDGIRDFVNKTHAESGLPPVPKKVSVLEVPQVSADAFTARSQATFQQVEDITKVNPTNLKQIMAARTDQIENLLAAGKEEEAGNLQQLQLNDENRMTKAFNDAKAKGVDVDQARSDWNKSLRADELSNAVRGSKSNLSTIAKPDIDPNKLTARLQKMYESQPGGKTAKLVQLGGDENATTLVEQAENAREAARAIKEFVPASATGQHALSTIIDNNTTEQAGLLGKAAGKTDWSGVVKDLGNLKPEEGRTMFGNEFAQVRQYAGRQAAKQLALRILIGGSPLEKIAKAGAVAEGVRRVL